MRARLLCKTGQLAGSSFDIDGEATIGRSPDNQIVVPEEVASARHARIYADEKDGSFYLEDLGSRNGVRVAGIRVREPERLGRLDVIRVAETFDFIFLQLPEGAARRPTRQVTLAEDAGFVPPVLAADAVNRKTAIGDDVAALPPSLDGSAADSGRKTQIGDDVALPAVLGGKAPGSPAGGTPDRTVIDEIEDVVLPPRAATESDYLLVVAVPGKEAETFPLILGPNVVGRTVDATIVIDHPTLSRAHATLTVGPHSVTLADLKSTNKTYVDGRPISNEVALRSGMKLRFGEVEARVTRKEKS